MGYAAAARRDDRGAVASRLIEHRRDPPGFGTARSDLEGEAGYRQMFGGEQQIAARPIRRVVANRAIAVQNRACSNRGVRRRGRASDGRCQPVTRSGGTERGAPRPPPRRNFVEVAADTHRRRNNRYRKLVNVGVTSDSPGLVATCALRVSFDNVREQIVCGP